MVLMLSTVVLLSLAILHKVSPFFTVYIFSNVGIFNIWPIDKVLSFKLFNFFISSAVVLYLLLFLSFNQRT